MSSYQLVHVGHVVLYRRILYSHGTLYSHRARAYAKFQQSARRFWGEGFTRIQTPIKINHFFISFQMFLVEDLRGKVGVIDGVVLIQCWNRSMGRKITLFEGGGVVLHLWYIRRSVPMSRTMAVMDLNFQPGSASYIVFVLQGGNKPDKRLVKQRWDRSMNGRTGGGEHPAGRGTRKRRPVRWKHNHSLTFPVKNGHDLTLWGKFAVPHVTAKDTPPPRQRKETYVTMKQNAINWMIPWESLTVNWRGLVRHIRYRISAEMGFEIVFFNFFEQF